MTSPSYTSAPTEMSAMTGHDRVETVESAFSWIVWAFAIASGSLLLIITVIVTLDAMPAIQEFGLSFLTGTIWSPIDDVYGALPFIYGTLVTSIIALIFSVPLGLAVAIVTSEDFLPIYVRSPISFMVELIASLPSVIIGLWGIFVFIPQMYPLQLWLNTYFGWFPLFRTVTVDGFEVPISGPSYLVAGMILAIMILPTIAAVSREVLLAIPRSLRSASMSLGATRWETIFKVMLPAAVSGILGGIILALGRALGETLAVTMVIGNTPLLTTSIISPGYSITSLLANQFAEAGTGLHLGSLMFLSLILFLITLCVNVAAEWLVTLVGRRRVL
ncbi:MAG: phosphate ABC transporter permease subunit PstC [Cyanobacteria bacterium P01_H01_bin.15]